MIIDLGPTMCTPRADHPWQRRTYISEYLRSRRKGKIRDRLDIELRGALQFLGRRLRKVAARVGDHDLVFRFLPRSKNGTPAAPPRYSRGEIARTGARKEALSMLEARRAFPGTAARPLQGRDRLVWLKAGEDAYGPFSGYGESLIDYDHKNNRIGVGLLSSD